MHGTLGRLIPVELHTDRVGIAAYDAGDFFGEPPDGPDLGTRDPKLDGKADRWAVLEPGDSGAHRREILAQDVGESGGQLLALLDAFGRDDELCEVRCRQLLVQRQIEA